MLYIIGLGLDIEDLSIKAMKIIEKAKIVYLESYTIDFPYSAEMLEKTIKKSVINAERDSIENNGEKIIEQARKDDVALLVYGDPLSATTHSDMLLRAKKENVRTQVVHNSSILTAVSDTGLQLYKFGKTASIPKWQESFKPESFYDLMKENQAINAHTLFLLDIGLDVSEALSYLRQISESRKESIKGIVIVCSRMGTKEQRIEKGRIEELEGKDFEKPACIIIPRAMHFMEAEMLENTAI